MEKDNFTVRIHALGARLLPWVLVLCALATVLGIPGICKIFTPEYRAYLYQDLVLGGIASGTALKTYLAIQMGLTAAGPLCACVLAVCLGVTYFRKSPSGISFLSTLAQWLVRLLNLAGLILVGAFVYHFVGYTIACLGMDGGLYPLYAMALFEALMVALAVLLFFTLRSFLNSLCDAAASIAYTLATGKMDNASIPAFSATGFLLLGIGCLLVAVDQMFTLTIATDTISSWYEILVSPQPAQWGTAAGLLCCALADGLLFLGLRRYKAICERILFENRSHIS